MEKPMEKDFKTIKEMTKKKILNSTDKAPLLKIFEGKILSKVSELKEKQTEELEKATKNTLAEIGNKVNVKKAMAVINQAEKLIKDSENLLAENCVKYDSDYSEKTKKLKLISGDYSYGERNQYPEALAKLRKEHKRQLKEAEELSTKIKLAFFEADITFADINEIIERELAKI